MIASPLAIPDQTLGSWGKLIDHWLMRFPGNKIDHLLCPASGKPLYQSQTKAIDCSYPGKEINRKWFQHWRFRRYTAAIERILQEHGTAVVLVIDNFKIKNVIAEWLAKHGHASKVRLIYYQCGFSYEFKREEYQQFKAGLNEIVLLTENAYQYERNKYHEYPFLVNILHNPIDRTVFYPLPAAERKAQRADLGWAADETVFLWVSHDRPKKGLDVILRLWPMVAERYAKVKLVIVGVDRKVNINGVQFMGKIPNKDIARFYRCADVFLFSSLCQEGFPLSLAEAMTCGCYCIASDAGGVREFLADTVHAINFAPHRVDEWMRLIDGYMKDPVVPPAVSPFMEMDEWCDRFQQILLSSAASLPH